MNYYHFKPEVPGQMGEGTVYNRESKEWEVFTLHIIFNVWQGGNILTVFPCYFITKPLQEKLLFNYSGIEKYRYLQVEKSEIFNAFYPNMELPEFSWVLFGRKPFEDDFAIAKYDEGYDQLIISEKARQALFEFPLGMYELLPAEVSKLG